MKFANSVTVSIEDLKLRRVASDPDTIRFSIANTTDALDTLGAYYLAHCDDPHVIDLDDTPVDCSNFLDCDDIPDEITGFLDVVDQIHGDCVLHEGITASLDNFRLSLCVFRLPSGFHAGIVAEYDSGGKSESFTYDLSICMEELTRLVKLDLAA